jgi:hypothetical protein
VKAAAHGHLDCLKYSYENGCPVYCAAVTAAQDNQLDCLKYAMYVDEYVNTEIVCFVAACCGNIDCLIYAHEECHGRVTDKTLQFAIGNNHTECIAYIQRQLNT